MTDVAQMLNPKEVAEILGVHQKTVHTWLRTGKLEGVKISHRAWRIPPAALTKFLESNTYVPKKTVSTPHPGPSEQFEKPHDTPKIISNDTPQKKMKAYIRDIMGEHPDTSSN